MSPSHMPHTSHRTARAVVAAMVAFGVFAGAAVVGVEAMSTPTATAADDPSDMKKRADARAAELRGQLDETSDELAKTYRALDSTRAKLPGARQRVRDAATAEAAADARNSEAEAAVRVAQANEQRAKDDIRATSSRIRETRERVAGFAAQMYQEQGLGQLSVAMSAESPDDVASRLAMADTVMEVQNSAIGELATTRANLVAKQDNLVALRKETEAAKVEAEVALEQAGVARRAAERAQSELAGIEASQASLASRLSQQKRAEQDSLASTQQWSDRLQGILEARALRARLRAERIAADKARREREQAAALAAARARREGGSPPAASGSVGGSGSAPVGNGTLSAPSNGVITSEFGPRFHPVLHFWRLHTGRDYAAGCGAPVFAAADGVVIQAGVAGGYGNQLVIDHGVERGVGLATTYNHLSAFVVTGGSVTRGQLIAREGTTGMSTGCHLHFETRENGVPVDPRDWL